MLTAIVWGVEAPRPFASTLSTLVPAAVDGALREVVVVGDLRNAESQSVADHAGCRIMTDGSPAIQVRDMKGAWLLLVCAGDRMTGAWLDAVAEHATSETRSARVPTRRASWPEWRDLIGWRPTACLMSRAAVEAGSASNWRALAHLSNGRALRVATVPND